MQKVGTLDGHVVRRYAPPLPRVVDVHDLTAVPLLLKGPFTHLVSSVFLGVLGYISIQAGEPPVWQIHTKPNETFIPDGGEV